MGAHVDLPVLVQPVTGGERFGRDRVEGCLGDAVVVEGGAQGVLVDERPPRDVDDVDARLHQCQRCRVDHPACAVRRRCGQHEVVGDR